MITHLSLFTGIGGLDLAAEWVGIQTIGQCEWAEYPTKVLEKHWPDVPRWKDIRTLTGESFYERTGRRTVDVISGGFPCQPFSVAGKQRGKEDDRYLWPEMVRVIKELRPTWVIGENVAGIVRMALADILSELEACGYRTRAFLIPACAVGARHRRYRVAIVAHSDRSGQLYRQNEIKPAKGREQAQRELKQRCEDVGYSKHNGLSSSEITRSTYKAGGGQQERKKETGESEGTGESRDDKDVANTYTERELQSAGNKQDIRNGIRIGCKTMAYTESKPAGRLPVGEKHEISGSVGCRKNVSDSNNRSRDVRRNRKLSAAEEAERAGHNIGGRAQKHEPGKWRSAESVLGRMADGISAGMDRDLDFLINHYWHAEPDIPRIATGIEHRVDRLKCLGNAVVPQQFYPIFKAIVEAEQTKGERR